MTAVLPLCKESQLITTWHLDSSLKSKVFQKSCFNPGQALCKGGLYNYPHISEWLDGERMPCLRPPREFMTTFLLETSRF